MMNLKFEGDSNQGLHQLKERLSAQVTNFNWFGAPKERSAAFVGKVDDSGFQINLIGEAAGRRHPCTLYGKFSPTTNGTHVNVIMSLSPMALIVLIAAISIVGIVITNNPRQDMVFGVSLMFLSLFCGLCYVFFSGASKSKKLLCDCLDLQIKSFDR